TLEQRDVIIPRHTPEQSYGEWHDRIGLQAGQVIASQIVRDFVTSAGPMGHEHFAGRGRPRVGEP
ncbi:MAG: hypothetical protein PVI01_01055, partial [Gemmatimonadales bacterium]